MAELIVPENFVKLNEDEYSSFMNVIKWNKLEFSKNSLTYNVTSKWIIRDFQLQMKNIESDEYIIHDDNCEWKFTFTIVNNILNDDAFDLCLHFKNSSSSQMFMSYEIIRTDLIGLDFRSQNSSSFKCWASPLPACSLSIRYFKIKDVLRDGYIKILSYFRLQLMDEEAITEKIIASNIQNNITLKQNDSKNDQDNVVFSCNFDVVLQVKEKKIGSHKHILSSNSEVFFKMFEKDPDIKNVEIVDVNFDIMVLMLKFIYTGKIEDVRKSVIKELLFASKKYLVEELTENCEMNLAEDIKIENAIDLLIFADENNVASLKEKTMNFIVKNFKSFKSQGFKELLKKPILLAEVIDNYSDF